MKIALVALLGILVAGTETAEAKCGCGSWLLTEKVVEGKPYVVVEAACGLGGKPAPAKITLADSRGKPIPATVVTTHDGYSSTVQYVFSPDRPLAPGNYQVTVDGAATSKLELEVVAASPGATPPRWTAAAKVVHQEQIEYGCGPGKAVEILAGTDSTLAFVELTDAGKQRMAGYVKVDKGTLRIGHGMCAGAFPLVRGHGYTAQITLLAPERGTSSSSKTVAFKYAP